MNRWFWLKACGFAGFVFVSLFSLSVQSQTDTDTSADPSSFLVPPKLVEYVDAVYPPEAHKAGLEAEVIATISIDENGMVTLVEIEEPIGNGFDEAAQDAMYQFIFEPAVKDGQAIPSKVLYRYTFFLKAESTEVTDALPSQPAALSGQVTDMDEAPVGDVTLILVKMDEDLSLTETDETGKGTDAISTTADKEGRFAVPQLEPGLYQVDVVAAGYKPFTIEETLEPGESRELIYRLELETSAYETVVRGRKPPREVTRREITRREITRIPGTGGDALRSVQNLPGMARAPGFSGQLLVRGSAPEDSRYFFDQTPIPMLYHFGGLTSVINSDLLERIDYYPGNYSVKYGGATGGIIDVYPKTPATDRVHAYVDADLWDISMLAETPIGDKWSIAVSGRRSYVDAILNAVMPDDGGFQFTVAPRYYDYQVVADYHPDNKDNLRLFIFGSDDKMIFLFGDSVADNPNFTGGVNFRTLFHQAQLRWEHHFSKHFSNELNIGTGYWGSDSSFGDNFLFDSDDLPIFFRDEVEWRATDKFILRTGADIQAHWATWKVIAATDIPGEGENMDPLTEGEPMTSDGQEWFIWPAWYAELEFLPVKDLRLIPGLRVAWFDQVNRVGIDPRFVARYGIFKNTTLKGGVGLFHQPPGTAQADDEFGNSNLELTKAMHYSVGVEQQLSDNIELSMEGFYKKIYDLVVSSDDQIEQNGQMVDERFNNDGEGNVYGFELLLKHQPTDRFFGWISYTFMNSYRIDHPGDDPRPFDYDQTHILTIVASAVLGRGWEAGVRFRLVTGNPDTPITGATYDADNDIYWPSYGETNSDRLPPFHQLDVRIDKKWQFKHINYSVYLDVQNVYNRKNVEGYQYNYDYSQRVYFYGMPIFPSIGMKFEY